MREIIRAENSGFCFGVKRAITRTEEQLAASGGKIIYTCGPLIHNRFVTDDLAKRGAQIIYSLDEVEAGETVTTVDMMG